MSTGTTATKAAGTTTLVSPAFTTAQTNEIVVVLVAVSDTGAGGTNILTTSLSGAGLTWTQVVQKNGSGNHVAAVYWALASAVLTAQTVTATVTDSNVTSWALHVLSFTGANTTTPIGASNSASNPNGTTASPSLTLATTAGSYCVAAGADYWNNATIATAGAAQTILSKFQDTTNGEVEWTQRTTSTTGTSTVLGDSGTGSDGWVFVAAEIKAAASALTWSQLADPAPLPPALLERWEVVGY